MKRRMRAVPVALSSAALLAGGCRGSQDSGQITASGHVEATEVLVSSKVAGNIESRSVDEGQVVERRPGARPDRHDRHAAGARRGARRPRPGRGRAAAAARRGARRGRARGAGAGGPRRGRPRRGATRPRPDGGPARRGLRHDEGARRRPHAPRRGRGARSTPRGSGCGALAAGSRPEEKDAARARLDAADARIAQLEQQLQDAVIAEPGEGRRDRDARREGRARRSRHGDRGGDRPGGRLAQRLRGRDRPRRGCGSGRRPRS